MASTSRLKPDKFGRDRKSENDIQELSRAECLKLLATHRLGRVAVVTRRETPVIRPVNYLYDQPSQSVVFKTVAGSKLHALRRATRAVFEIDGVDPEARAAWSVIVEGVTTEVTRPGEVDRLDDLHLRPWPSGPTPHWIQVRVWTVSGRRILLADHVLADEASTQ